MTEREALVQLATPEPDTGDPADPEWQMWRDLTTEALLLARNLGSVSELEPAFAVRVRLDGDESAVTAADDVLDALKRTVAALKADGLIVDGEAA